MQPYFRVGQTLNEAVASGIGAIQLGSVVGANRSIPTIPGLSNGAKLGYSFLGLDIVNGQLQPMVRERGVGTYNTGSPPSITRSDVYDSSDGIGTAVNLGADTPLLVWCDAMPEDFLMLPGGEILGTVSQSGGDPTGALIERGNNANGEYRRFACGAQICWHSINAGARNASGSGTYGSPYRTSPHDMTFPAVFAAVPAVSYMPITDASDGTQRQLVGFARRVETTQIIQAQAVALNSDLGSTVVTLHYCAFGRWF